MLYACNASCFNLAKAVPCFCLMEIYRKFDRRERQTKTSGKLPTAKSQLKMPDGLQIDCSCWIYNGMKVQRTRFVRCTICKPIVAETTPVGFRGSDLHGLP